MKTPKRRYTAHAAPQRQDIVDCTLEGWKCRKDTRWKRKNLVKQLKRTIERLLKKNNDMAAVLKTVQRAIAVILADDTTSVEMSLKWETAAGRKEATRKARLIRRAHRRACRAINSENAKQTNIPPTGGQQTTHP